jgi:hypothetical protein
MRMDEYMHMDNNPVKEFTIVEDVTSEEELCHGKDVKLVAISLRFRLGSCLRSNGHFLAVC